MDENFDIYVNESGKVTHAIYTDTWGAQRLYPYRWNAHTRTWDNVSGNVTKRTLQRDNRREPEDQHYKWA